MKLKLADKSEVIFENAHISVDIISFENDGISLGIHITGLKYFEVKVYDCLNEKFADEYHNFLQCLDPFITEAIESEVKKCFATK